jgi:histidyl-tRNA synthetase
MDYGAKGLKAQMKKAGRLGARMVLIVGGDELASGRGVLRDMASKVQQAVDLGNVASNLRKALKVNDGNQRLTD